MELPVTVRRRLQSAMPNLPPSLPLSLSCQPPTLSSAVLASLQPGIPTPQLAPLQRLIPCQRPSTNLPAKSMALASQNSDTEIDPWTLLEEGTVSASASNSSSNMGAASGDHSTNLKACSWLKGAVRVRRTDLTYIGALDDDS